MLSQYFLEVVPKNKTVKYSMLLKFFRKWELSLTDCVLRTYNKTVNVYGMGRW